jgi:hypothetical protein
LVDDDLRIVAAEPDKLGQRRVGRVDVVERADANPIKPLTVPVDWRDEKSAAL